MSSTEQRRTANHANALKCTGPASASGKAAASLNAMRHGFLCVRLLLYDECADEFQRLQSELQSALDPVGHMELALVERLAITLWQQRRLVTAESAAIGLTRLPRKVAGGVNSEMGLGYGSELKEDDLQPYDPDRTNWCNAVIAEVQNLELINPESLPRLAPKIFEQLKSDAEEDGESIEDHRKSHKDGITGFVAELLKWCHEKIGEAAKRPAVLSMAQQARARRLILPNDAIEILSRYQTTLDNQLYKALRALREAQEWRLKTLGSKAGSDAEPLEAAA